MGSHMVCLDNMSDTIIGGCMSSQMVGVDNMCRKIVCGQYHRSHRPILGLFEDKIHI